MQHLPRSKKVNKSNERQVRLPKEMHWEQKFCQTNGVRWGKLIETKRYLHQYSDIASWDDSAGKEAFDNAKAGYWAQINGLQPEISLPDPDMFIDTIDHDAPVTNLKLYQNLHSLSEDEADEVDGLGSDEWGEGGVILLDSHYEKKEEEVVWDNIATGWGHDYPIHPTGWGDIPIQANVQSDAWGVVQKIWIDNSVNPTGWGDMAVEPSPAGTRYEGIVPTGWSDSGHGYEHGPGVSGVSVSEEPVQYWNYCNSDRYHSGTRGSYNRNYPKNRRYRGRYGWNTNHNTTRIK